MRPLRNGQHVEPTDRPGFVKVTGPCFVTGKEYSIVVREDGLNSWRRGTNIQRALPEVPDEEREFLLSATSPEGWAQLFPDDDDAEDFAEQRRRVP